VDDEWAGEDVLHHHVARLLVRHLVLQLVQAQILWDKSVRVIDNMLKRKDIKKTGLKKKDDDDGMKKKKKKKKKEKKKKNKNKNKNKKN
jgi:hypothetical protein